MFSHISKLIVMLMALALLSACNGSTSLAEGGIGGTGISTGTVTGFASIYVNGVKYDTATSEFLLEDRNGDLSLDQNDLEKGMVVTVFGQINSDGVTGTAETVEYTQSLEGPIEGTPGASSFVVLGRTVLVDAKTKIKDGLIYPDDFADSYVVEVSGFLDTTGQLHARYIEKTDDPEHSILGVVTNDALVNQFELNSSLIVNWTDLSYTPNNGDYVEVKGVYNSGTGEFDAISVEVETEGFDVKDIEDAELEGLALATCDPLPGPIGTPDLPCQFSLGGQTVEVNATTTFNVGSYLDIQPGSLLEVEGSVANGILIAEEVEFEDEAEVEAEVDTVSADDGSGNKTLALLDGNGVLDALTVIINDKTTEFETDGGTANYINPLADGNHLVFKGQMNDAGDALLVTRVETGSPPDIKLEAIVDSFVADTSITLLGLTIETSGLSFVLDDDNGGQAITASEFYNYIEKNTAVVEVTGTIDTGIGAVTWDEIELEL